MKVAKRFLFEHSFDAGPPFAEREDENEMSAEDVANENAPTYTADDLTQAHERGMAEGREKADAEAAVAVEQRIAEALTLLGDRISELFTDRHDAATRATGDATMVATAIARKMVPEFYSCNAANEIEHTVATILDRMFETPKLTVRVSERFHDELSERIAALAEEQGFAGRVAVNADPKIGEGDCRVEWAGGGAELNSAARWREIDAIIERSLRGGPAAVAPVSDHMETNKALAVDPIAEPGGRNPSHHELEDDHG
jgi:flagellar assembly protein FliH